MVDLFTYPTIQTLANHISPEQKVQKKRVFKEAKAEQSPDIAIIGMAGKFPKADDIDEFWENIKNGVECIHRFTDEELQQAGVPEDLIENKNYVKAKGIIENSDCFDTEFFGYTGKQAQLTDPQIRLFLETAWHALEDAGYHREQEAGRVGVFAGAGSFHTYLSYLESIAKTTRSFAETYQLITNNASDYLATRVSYQFNLTGPSFTTQTACSTSLVTVIQACKHLLHRECDMALAGGVAIGVPMKMGYVFEEGMILSPDGHCRAFDSLGQGTVPGNGVGAVVLKRLEDALDDGDRIYAVIRGYAINNDGSSKVGYTAPSVEKQSEAIRQALSLSNISADTLSLYEAHGTATPMGDPIEIAAASKAYRVDTDKKQFCPIGSVKSNLGHLDTAAGVTSLIKAVLAIKNKTIPPSLHFQSPNPKLQLEDSPFYVPTESKPWESDGVARRAAISSFGIGGTNAHVIIEEAPTEEPEVKPEQRPLSLLTLSAKSEAALNRLITCYMDFISKNPEVSYSEMAYTTNVGRAHFAFRAAFVIKDLDDALEQLKAGPVLRGEMEPGVQATIGFTQEAGSANDKTLFVGDSCDWKATFNTLAKHYIEGADIDWAECHQNFPSRKISLPGYCFEATRCWPAIPKTSAAGPMVGEHLHPLLGRLTKSASSPITFFESTVSATWPEFVPDHKLYGNTIIAGAAYMSALMSALSSLNIQKGHLKDVEFQRPLILTAGSQKRLQTVFEPSGDEGDEQRFNIYSCDEQDLVGETDWILHVSGRVGYGLPEIAELKKYPIADLVENPRSVCEKAPLYEAAGELGLQLGPTFQWVDKVYLGEDALLARMRKPDAGGNESNYLLHPGFLDSCLLVYFAKLLEQGKNDMLTLPISIRESWYERPDEYPEYIHVTATTEGESLDIDMLLLNEAGECIGGLRGFRSRRAPREVLERALVTEEKADQLLYETIWVPKMFEVQEAETTAGAWLLVSEDNAFAKALEAELVSKGMSVTRQDSHQLSLESCAAEGDIAGVVYVAPMPEGDIEFDHEALKGLVTLSQSLVEYCNTHKGPHLSIVTRLAEPVNGGETNLSHVSIDGFRRTFELENIELNVCQMDIEKQSDQAALAKEVINESLNYTEDEVAYREGHRYISRLFRQKNAKVKRNELTRPADEFHLTTTQRGLLENMTLSRLQKASKLSEHEVELNVFACGLNFRDVLNVLGLYPGDPGQLGNDGAGVVTRVGEKVTEFKVGDAVYGLMDGSLASHAVTSEFQLCKKPESLSYEDASAVPTIFLTVHYAINNLAKLKAGEKILIHAGTGGVGLTAIQMAQHIGAEIYTTAGSDEKRNYLKGLGVEHVFDSRSLSYGKDIEEATKGQGVDVVLNSLSGEGFIETTVGVCAKDARFLEIGKRDIWTVEEMKEKRPDIHYSVILLDDIVKATPERIREMLGELSEKFDAGDLKAIPVRHYPIERSIDAFAYMRDAKQIGKIVIQIPAPVGLQGRIDTSSSYLITGGLGGLGLKVAEWLVQQGARSLFITGRKAPNDDAQALISELKNSGVEVVVSKTDITDQGQIQELLKEIQAAGKPLRGIYHLAGVLDDAPFMSLNWDRFETVLAPKVKGAWLLYQTCKSENIPLQHMVLFSSISSRFGSAAQANYSAANAFLSGFAHYLNQQGIDATAVEWGPWAEVGMAAALSTGQQQKNIVSLKPKDALAAMEMGMLSQSAVVTVADVKWSNYLSSLSKTLPLFSEFLRSVEVKEEVNIIDRLASSADDKKHEILKVFVEDITRDVFGLSEEQVLEEEKGFFDIGMDSLQAVEFRNKLVAALGDAVSLSTTIIFDFPNLLKLTSHLAEMLALPEEKAEVPAEKEASFKEKLTEDIESLSDLEAIEMLEKEISDRAKK